MITYLLFVYYFSPFFNIFGLYFISSLFFISVSCLVALRAELMKREEKLKLYGRRSWHGKSEFFFKIKMKGSTIFLIIEDSNFSDWLLFQGFKILWIYHFHLCLSLREEKLENPGALQFLKSKLLDK